MAKFLDTTGGSAHIVQIIKGANERLVLISPFLKTGERIRELLADRENLKVDITVVYGKKRKLRPDEWSWLTARPGIRVHFWKNLHAKCYLNEKAALRTSMNLHEFSQQHNDEMGILVERETDPELYADIWAEVQRLVRISGATKASAEHGVADETVPRTERPWLDADIDGDSAEDGFCIACGRGLSLDPEYPYCRRCYRAWRAHGDDRRKEKYCHACGTDNRSTLIRPVCTSCYRRLN